MPFVSLGQFRKLNVQNFPNNVFDISNLSTIFDSQSLMSYKG